MKVGARAGGTCDVHKIRIVDSSWVEQVRAYSSQESEGKERKHAAEGRFLGSSSPKETPRNETGKMKHPTRREIRES